MSIKKPNQVFTTTTLSTNSAFSPCQNSPPNIMCACKPCFTRYSDSGVSKTINLPATATKAEGAAAFLLAYQLGCKGLTVFRTGSRERQVLSCGVRAEFFNKIDTTR